MDPNFYSWIHLSYSNVFNISANISVLPEMKFMYKGQPPMCIKTEFKMQYNYIDVAWRLSFNNTLHTFVATLI